MSSEIRQANYVFKKKDLNDQLEKQGFVIVDFLNTDEIKSLITFFKTGEESKRDVFTTFATNDYMYKRDADEVIKNAFSRSFEELFGEFIPFWGNFFNKKPMAPAMPLHADFQYVNEPDNISLNIWCPLADTNADNGTLGLIPGSHHILNQIRGTNITDSYRLHAKEIELAFGKIIELKAGQAIIYDHRLLHYSLPNNSATPRLAVTLIAIPQSVKVIHYYADFEGDTTFHKYVIKSADDFFKTNFMQKPAHLTQIETICDYIFKPLTVSDFQILNDHISR